MIAILVFLFLFIGAPLLLHLYGQQQKSNLYPAVKNLTWPQRVAFTKLQTSNRVMSCLELWGAVSLEMSKVQPDCNYHFNELMQDVKHMAETRILELTDEDASWGGIVSLNYWLKDIKV